MASMPYNASAFSPSLGTIGQLLKYGKVLGNQGFSPDLSSVGAFGKALDSAPLTNAGSGQLVNTSPLSQTAGLQTNAAGAQELTGQAQNFDQRQLALSDFLTTAASDKSNIQALLAQLKAMNLATNSGGVGAAYGAFL